MKQVIFTADDFGLAREVNEAIERAHSEGVLSAASLMVGAPEAADAIARAKRLPTLRVGLHVAVADGRALLPHTAIPSLADRNGDLPRNLARAGVHWFFSPAARRDLAAEIRAQFAAFRATGLPLDHVNAHNHMHLHPTVLGIILAVARDFGAPPMRLPWEPPAGLLAPWLWILRVRLRAAGVRHNDAIVGMRDTGHLTESRVLKALTQIQDGVTEFYFHPASRTTAALEAQAPGYEREGELSGLLSPAVAACLNDMGLKTKGFGDLR
ncbi:MAG: hopanoid biosynthesis-associated protein HpnK [Rhodospirillaceae bacterium]